MSDGADTASRAEAQRGPRRGSVQSPETALLAEERSMAAGGNQKPHMEHAGVGEARRHSTALPEQRSGTVAARRARATKVRSIGSRSRSLLLRGREAAPGLLSE
ncbi:hypothetical protein Aduo_012756 [Ancylostoma duodenale]